MDRSQSRIYVCLALLLVTLRVDSQEGIFQLVSPIESRSLVEYTISGDSVIRPFFPDKAISGLAITCDLLLQSDSSLVRIVLVDTLYHEYLICESYTLLQGSNQVSFSDYAEETAVLDNICPKEIRFEITNAQVFLKEISTSTGQEQTKSARRDQLNHQHLQKIETLNKNIRSRGMRWVAGITSISALSYYDKQKLFGGRVPNLYGFDYYVGGIFVMPGALDSASTKKSISGAKTGTTSDFAREFSWRNRHGLDWMTSVKNQFACGSCWAFAATGAVELLVNLYYNRHLDMDLSEQQLVSCSDAGDCSGGSAEASFDYIGSIGQVTESCFPYVGDEPLCNLCGDPTERIWVGDNYQLKREFDSIKKAIIQGPVYVSVTLWDHALTLAGYKTIEKGDRIYIRTSTDNSWIIVPEGDPLIGKTAWLIKNSWGDNWGMEGYAYLLIDKEGFGGSYRLEPLIRSLILEDSDVQCTDFDGDGYYNWGIGPKPAQCPPCPDDPDGDDTDACLGPMNEYGKYQHLTPKPFAPDVIVDYGDPVPNLIAEGTDIHWYEDENCSSLVHSGISYATGLTDPGVYDFYVTQTVDGCESNPSLASLTIHLEVPHPEVGDISGCKDYPVQITATGENITWYNDSDNSDIRDGQSYKSVQIGEQTWMAENLNYFTPEGSKYYEYDSLRYSGIYGRLYDWETACFACPPGWKLPSDEDWKILERYLGMDVSEIEQYSWRGTNEGNKLKEVGSTHWLYNNEGTNEYGFTALPSGWITNASEYINRFGYYWTSTEDDFEYGIIRGLASDSPYVLRGSFEQTGFYLAVRCIKKTGEWDVVGTGNTFIHTFLGEGTYRFFVTQSISGFESPADTVFVTISSETAPPVAIDRTISYGETEAVLHAEGGNIKWYADQETSQLLAMGNTFDTGNTDPGIYEYYVTQTICNESLPVKVTMTIILPPPTANDVTSCLGDSIPDLSATGNNIRWYSDIQLTNLLHSGITYTTDQNLPGNYTYYATQTVNDVESPYVEVHQVIYSIPLSPTAEDVWICSDSPLTALSASGSDIRWYRGAGLTDLLHKGNDYIPEHSEPGTYSYFLTQSDTYCESLPDTCTFIILPVPSLPLTEDLDFCEGDTGQELLASGENIKWYSDKGLTVTIGTGNSFKPAQFTSGRYIYYATQTDSGCESNANKVELNIHSPPEIDLGNDTTIQTDQIVILGPFESENSYSWSDGSEKPYLVFHGSNHEPGSYKIILIVSDPNGCADSDSTMINVIPFTGTGSSKDNLLIHIYPNPANGIIRLDPIGWNGADILVRIYNQNGIEYKIFEFESILPGDPLYMDVSDLRPGVYYLQLQTIVENYHGIFVIL